jgi:CheY-like chemotaxis protein
MKRNILLVDDDASLLATLGDFLEFEGYEVTKAKSGEQALAMLRLRKPDLIVLDMSMPGIGGMGVLDRLQLPDGSMRYPVLVLTARAQMAEYFADKQVDGFIAKPCDPEDLAMEVSRIIFQQVGREFDTGQPAAPIVLLGGRESEARAELKAGLESDGYDVRCYSSGGELLEAAILDAPALVVLHWELSDQTADITAQVLFSRPRTTEVPVIVHGLADSQVGQLEILGSNPDNFLALPVTETDKLRHLVAEMFTS